MDHIGVIWYWIMGVLVIWVMFVFVMYQVGVDIISNLMVSASISDFNFFLSQIFPVKYRKSQVFDAVFKNKCC